MAAGVRTKLRHGNTAQLGPSARRDRIELNRIKKHGTADPEDGMRLLKTWASVKAAQSPSNVESLIKKIMEQEDNPERLWSVFGQKTYFD